MFFNLIKEINMLKQEINSVLHIGCKVMFLIQLWKSIGYEKN